MDAALSCLKQAYFSDSVTGSIEVFVVKRRGAHPIITGTHNEIDLVSGGLIVAPRFSVKFPSSQHRRALFKLMCIVRRRQLLNAFDQFVRNQIDHRPMDPTNTIRGETCSTNTTRTTADQSTQTLDDEEQKIPIAHIECGAGLGATELHTLTASPQPASTKELHPQPASPQPASTKEGDTQPASTKEGDTQPASPQPAIPKGGTASRKSRSRKQQQHQQGSSGSGSGSGTGSADVVPTFSPMMTIPTTPTVTLPLEVAGKISSAFGSGLVTLVVDHLTCMSQLTAFYRTFRLGAAYTLIAERMSQESRRAMSRAMTSTHRIVLPILNAWTNLALVLERPGRCDPGLLERRSGALLAECTRYAKEHITVTRGDVVSSEVFVKMAEQLDRSPSLAFALARIGSTLTLNVALLIRMLALLFEYHRTTQAFPTPVAICADNPIPALRQLEYPDPSLMDAHMIHKLVSPTTATSHTQSTRSSSSHANLRASFTELLSNQAAVPRLQHLTKDQGKAIVQTFIRQIAIILHGKLMSIADPESRFALRPIKYEFVTDYEDWISVAPKRYITQDGSGLEGFIAAALGVLK
jgi:hypothetical protein